MRNKTEENKNPSRMRPWKITSFKRNVKPFSSPYVNLMFSHGMRYELGTKPEQQTSILLLPLLSQFADITRIHHIVPCFFPSPVTSAFISFRSFYVVNMKIYANQIIYNEQLELNFFFFGKMSNKWRSWIQFSQKKYTR